MTKRSITLAAAVLVGSAAITVSADAKVPGGTHPCATATSRCEGTVEVPLNWADPDSERISVPFAWVPRTDRSKPAPTVAFLPGGPASTMLIGVSPRPDYDQLIVERRGFGKASPLDCPEIDVYKPDTVTACATRLGPRVQYITTDQRVADIDAVRAALGVDKLTLYGSSYGGVDAPAYVARYPQHTAAVIVDSPSLLPDKRTGYLSGLMFQQDLDGKLRATADVCAPSQACRRLPGDAESRVAKVAQMLRAQPDPKLHQMRLGSVIKLLDPMVAQQANAAMDAFINGDKAPLYRLAELAGPPPGSGDANDMIRSLGTASLAYMCNDMSWPYDRLATPQVRRQQLAEYRRLHPEHPLTVAESTDGVGIVEDWCTGWPTPREAPPVPPNTTYTDVPALIIGGTHEPNAAANATELAGRFRRGTAMVVPFGGHVASLRTSPYGKCAHGAVEEFIAAPARPVRARCSGENFRALGHFPRTSTDPLQTAFSTAMDVLAPRNPNTSGLNRIKELPGLRGGKVSYDDPNQRITLDGVRYVADVAVSGEIQRPDANGWATAEFTLSTGEAFHLKWKPFEAREVMTVTGTRNNRPFIAHLRTT